MLCPNRVLKKNHTKVTETKYILNYFLQTKKERKLYKNIK